jgi:hypothetical protein
MTRQAPVPERDWTEAMRSSVIAGELFPSAKARAFFTKSSTPLIGAYSLLRPDAS